VPDMDQGQIEAWSRAGGLLVVSVIVFPIVLYWIAQLQNRFTEALNAVNKANADMIERQSAEHAEERRLMHEDRREMAQVVAENTKAVTRATVAIEHLLTVSGIGAANPSEPSNEREQRTTCKPSPH